MGVVYRATDRLTNQNVALKRVMAPASLPQEQPFGHRLALAQEFQLLAGLRHPNIISVLDYGFDDQHLPFFTMDLLPGPQTIIEAGRNKSLTVQVDLIIQVLQALTYLHRRQVLHNDLKPANVLVVGDQLKLLDFGLSLTGTTNTGQNRGMSGTWAYMAPEMLRGQTASQASDLFAVGVMMYEMLAGKRPFTTLRDTLNSDLDETLLPNNQALRAVIRRFLATAPGRRFPSAPEAIYALCQALNQTLPLETKSIRDSFLHTARFTGREAELKQLTTLLTTGKQGQGTCLLIGGESGVGKSRLLNELYPIALVEGILVIRGRSAREAGVPYALWQTAVRRLALLVELDNFETTVLSTIVPDLHLLTEQSAADRLNLDTQALQKQIGITFTSLFQRQPLPILLLLDDLQWARPESIALLRQLQEITSSLPLVILGTYRDDEAPDLPQKIGSDNLLKLNRLAPSDIAKLSVSILGQNGYDPSLLSYLQRQTEGNTFFLVEVIRSLAERAGHLDQIAQIDFPEDLLTGGVRQLLQQRLQQVTLGDRLLLQQAAVLGRTIDLKQLQAIYPAADLNHWLNRCAEAAILNVEDEKWQFAHDKLRDGLLAGLADSDLQALHQQAAQALEQSVVTDPQRAATVAYHWQMAKEPEKERPYAFIAGIQALESNAYQQALTHFERAKTLAGDTAETATVLREIGRCYYGLGNYPQAQIILQQSLVGFESVGYEADIARTLYHLSNVTGALGQYKDAWAYGRRSLNIARQIDDQPGIARALTNLGSVEYRLGDNEEALRHHKQSLAVAEALADKWLMTRVLNNLGNVFYQLGDFEEAAVYYHRALELSQDLNNRRGISMVLNNLALIAERQEDFSTARQHHQSSLQLKRAIGDRSGISISLMNLGVIEYATGNHQESAILLTESLEIAREIGDSWGVACCLSNLADVDTMLGHFEAAAQKFTDALQVSLDIDARPLAMSVLTSALLMFIKIDQPQSALQMAGFLQANPATDGFDQLRLAEGLQELAGMVPAERMTATLAAGKKQTIEDMKQLLEQGTKIQAN